ncbi:DNA/RNA non-specific endonuclease [Collinsella sp. zg1085]|uniref:DNA/RNA non-specific endonuclease n=1 Tax=Collinsella sp. zg1085 TaxID=2844380 RepID=UPI001C0D9E0E|nr:DNA/RNA non-specific endonuclease [Collinsella sp. zg1085]QWT17896.1 DNA/RNA non-specific endonuclease [Collinsella sp. zg1085]
MKRRVFRPSFHRATRRVFLRARLTGAAALLALVVSAAGQFVLPFLHEAPMPAAILRQTTEPIYKLLSQLNPEELPAYDGTPSVALHNNKPSFDISDFKDLDAYELYAPLDELGRVGVACAVVSPAALPTKPRGSIAHIRPTGWHTVRYDDLIEDHYLYNRCHLLGYQLTGENDNAQNLMTGTRYLNTEGMLPYEQQVARYVHETGGRVALRVTPVFVGDELVARGVEMEALSLDDGGAQVQFHVYCYNVQPGIEIDYANGDSKRTHSE